MLEDSFELLLANAHRIQNVPGRKTDVNDSAWIAKLLRCGLIEGSFVPPEAIRDLRDLTRYRRKLVSDATAEKNRIHKILQDGNIKMTTYISDIFGVSGRALLESLVNGEVLEVEQVQQMVKTQLKKKAAVLVDALNGRIRAHHRDMIRRHYDHLLYLENEITALETRIDQLIHPYKKEIELLDTIPGISKDAAASILAEIGPDMSVFPTEAHLAAWGGLAPSNNESAGKKKESRSRKGNKGLKSVLCQCAWSAVKSKNTRLSALYYRLVKRRGPKKAIMAVAHAMLRIIYTLLSTSVPYEELGADYVSKKERDANYWIRKLQSMGYQVEIQVQAK